MILPLQGYRDNVARYLKIVVVQKFNFWESRDG